MKTNATKTAALSKRIDAQKNQSIDLNEWIFSQLPLAANNKVLELCCGIGAQTKFFSRRITSGQVTCVDINPSSIEKNIENVRDSKIKYIVSGLDDINKYALHKYDLIFSAYGFYYSKNPKLLHKTLNSKLTNGGKFVLVGPVLGNNRELYQIVLKAGGIIPKAVSYSSEFFMLDFLQEFLLYYPLVKFQRIENKIKYSSAAELLSYWKNTTFYTPGNDKKFIKETSKYFGREISITKSLSFLQGECP